MSAAMEFFRSVEFPARVNTLMKEHRTPGLAVAVVQHDEVASMGFGLASLDQAVSVTADTLFDIASCSKALTAASIGLLVDDNENYPDVQYDAIMSKLLPDDFVMPGTGYTENVTVEDILSHRSGMARPRAQQPDDARSVTRNLRNLPVAAPLRTKFQYCNMMYTVATYLIEAKTGQSFSNFLQARFFEPLDMQSTSLQPQSARVKGFGDRIATGYAWNKKKKAYSGFQAPDCPEAQGAGSIITSVNDFIRFLKALINQEGPISKRLYQGLVRMRTFENPNLQWLKPGSSPNMYAAGIEAHFYRGYLVLGHDGCVPGFGSHFFFLPDFKFGCFVAGNAESGATIGTILRKQLIDAVIGVPKLEHWHRNKKNATQPQSKGDLFVSQRLKPSVKRGLAPQNKAKNGQRHSMDSIEPQPQEKPLSTYLGTYWHPGYHTLVLQIENDKLFIDATDRSMGFSLTFDHVHGQTKYTAHMSDFLEGGDVPLDAEFIFEGEKVVKMGLSLDQQLKEMIWFERLEQSLQCTLMEAIGIVGMRSVDSGNVE
ncbi:predicted protein [Uncinocarpus reesii 1704]|uniref:Beta-lactamase-related domain-containing protein n=1 Tax=Uncinocarpus reesii (strain UAMH 1704) TaxID=336963 RepID=C4JUP2_UNCRE|nr:uncharacterized protein UREG_04845 [Uncinocarpus reesii 1704]EEP80003.1 predicted protein [Uncinocarpus reesii 1704]